MGDKISCATAIDSDTVTVYNNDMQEHKSQLTIEELAEQVDIPVRTIRYYITEGLLPGPEGRGKATTYGEDHLQRLRLIRLLSNQRRPLAEIYHLLNQLSLAEVRTLLAEEEQRASELERASKQPPPQEYIATLLKNARAFKRTASQEPVSPPAPVPSQSVVKELPSSRHIYERPRDYEVARESGGEVWRRWELVPGVELHVREHVEEQHLDLIARICKIAGVPFYRLRR